MLKELRKYVAGGGKIPVGGGALRTNEKTFLSIDIAGACPFTDAGRPAPTAMSPSHRAPGTRKRTLCTSRRHTNLTRTAWALSPGGVSTQMAQKMWRAQVHRFPEHKDGWAESIQYRRLPPRDAELLDKIVQEARDVGLTLKVITKQPEMVARYEKEAHVFFNLSVDFINEPVFNKARVMRIKKLLTPSKWLEIHAWKVQMGLADPLPEMDPKMLKAYVQSKIDKATADYEKYLSNRGMLKKSAKQTEQLAEKAKTLVRRSTHLAGISMKQSDDRTPGRTDTRREARSNTLCCHQPVRGYSRMAEGRHRP